MFTTRNTCAAGPGRAATGCHQKSNHSLAAKQTLVKYHILMPGMMVLDSLHLLLIDLMVVTRALLHRRHT